MARIIWLATTHGVIGVAFGTTTGAIVGAGMGPIFGGGREGIAFGVWYGVIVDSVTFAWTGVVLDEGPGTELFAWRSAMSKPVILFLYTNNAVRSQMAEALLRKKAVNLFEPYSAGTDPKEIHPLTVKVMSEVGIDLTGQHAKSVREFLGRLPVRYAVFVCQRADEKCPTLWPGALNRLEWPFDDPASFEGPEEERVARFRSVRDQIDQKITSWLAE